MHNKTVISKRFWSTVIVAVVCGAAAGVLGEIVTRVYILKDFSVPYLSGEVNFANLDAGRTGLIIRDAKKVVVNQDVKITETIAGVRPVLVSIFKEIPATSPTASSNYYKLDEPLFIGFIITADGWGIASPSPELRNDLKTKDFVAITDKREVYKIDEISGLKNLPGGLMAFHLAGASNLPVKKIVPRSELALGETLLVIGRLDSVWPTTLSSLSEATEISSSETLNARLKLAGAASGDYADSFVFNLAGDLTAAVNAAGEVVPAFSYNSFLPIFTKDQSARPFLGLHYLNLSVIKTTAVNFTKGAWVQAAPKVPAIIKDSPAEAVGLLSGDIITWVNNQEINETNDLADIIATYKAGDSVTLTYWRDGAEKSVVVKLTELK